MRWFSPILCFTCEEVMQSRFPDHSESVHELEFLSADTEWLNNELFEKWEKIRSVRRVVTGAIELERKEKRIGSSLEAFPNVYISNKEYLEIFRNIDLAEIFITSQAKLTEGEGPENAFRLSENNLSILSIFIFLLDFFSKYFLINFYDLGSKGRVSITPFLDFILVLNPGISFGLFSSGEDIQRWILSILSIIIIFYLYYWARNSSSKLIKLSLFIMIGGALGNLFDRVFYGNVIDFISLHVFNYYWYVFNIADIAIVFGGLFVLIDLTKDSFKKK